MVAKEDVTGMEVIKAARAVVEVAVVMVAVAVVVAGS